MLGVTAAVEAQEPTWVEYIQELEVRVAAEVTAVAAWGVVRVQSAETRLVADFEGLEARWMGSRRTHLKSVYEHLSGPFPNTGIALGPTYQAGAT